MDDLRAVLTFALVVTVILLSIWVGASALEANAYRRLTGKQVSTWDAMFIELRVQEPVAAEPTP